MRLTKAALLFSASLVSKQKKRRHYNNNVQKSPKKKTASETGRARFWFYRLSLKVMIITCIPSNTPYMASLDLNKDRRAVPTVEGTLYASLVCRNDATVVHGDFKRV